MVHGVRGLQCGAVFEHIFGKMDKNVFYKSLREIEKTIFSSLIDETRKSLRYYVKSNNGNSNFKRFFISGGFAEIDGLKEKISNELRIETHILNPFNNIETDIKIENPSKYSIAVGLALRGLL